MLINEFDPERKSYALFKAEENIRNFASKCPFSYHVAAFNCEQTVDLETRNYISQEQARDALKKEIEQPEEMSYPQVDSSHSSEEASAVETEVEIESDALTKVQRFENFCFVRN